MELVDWLHSIVELVEVALQGLVTFLVEVALQGNYQFHYKEIINFTRELICGII